jgi:hypothetical protein
VASGKDPLKLLHLTREDLSRPADAWVIPENGELSAITAVVGEPAGTWDEWVESLKDSPDPIDPELLELLEEDPPCDCDLGADDCNSDCE